MKIREVVDKIVLKNAVLEILSTFREKRPCWVIFLLKSQIYGQELH